MLPRESTISAVCALRKSLSILNSISWVQILETYHSHSQKYLVPSVINNCFAGATYQEVPDDLPCTEWSLSADRRQAPLGPDTPLFGSRIPPGTSTQSPNTSISPSTLFDIFDGARHLLEARHGRPDASRIDLGTSPAFGEQ
ncbi:predicted protein [Postia placenta Mad-698-R]|uniref:Uncharacterized protein n=1 Tax=Postia placenta MAD-698-R-SB12 TaxID=670580 RepID=A0A1X6MRB3_9APHY|nr:hypothetical protein POSPLADRAFT_1151441 [Postia placenta MAD-698-R-SB12]EED82188.1 predicted protein [Postia placenta Mad-698-R]OSX58934.1 hypothetical protein POSPLADRAFT_1151441 [Postia placenta MAD-698-R-SB12]